MELPEPCIEGRCFSPVACNGWGYCRERNKGRAPSQYQIDRRRADAVRSRDKAARSDARTRGEP